MKNTTHPWDKRISKAEKFQEKALEHGRNVYRRYEDDREDTVSGNMSRRCNLFYSNTNTIKESLFNSLPKPDVKRLHTGDYEDEPSRVAALILQRSLNYVVQCTPNFKDSVENAILDRLVPGTGQVWVMLDEENNISLEHVFWEDFIYEPAREWDGVTWVGRKLELSKGEVTERWGKDALNQLQAPRKGQNSTPNEILQDKFCVYEIWDKASRTVIHWAMGLEEPLEIQEDPYNLRDFFPCPKPLIANPTTISFLPVTDYHLAQDQYLQLDELYGRIGLIIKAVKVAGVYDGSEKSSIGRMLQEFENTLVPVDNWAMYAEKGGAKGMIDWYPVEQVVQVLQALQASYEAIKSVLYEVTGMSDIVRGASNQYETAQAQEIKAQFASVRLNGYQRDVEYFVTNILNIICDLICNTYPDDKIMQITGTITQQDQQFLLPASQILRSNILRMYKVSIQADSLTQADWALEKGQRMELVGFISQFLTSALPAVQNIPELGPLLIAMLKFSVAGFKGSYEIEGILDNALEQLVKAQQQGQQNKEPSPEQQKAQLEQQKMQMQAQLEQMKLQAQMQIEQQKAQMESQLAQQKAQLDATLKERESQQRMQLEATQAQADMAVKELEMQHKREMFQLEMQIKQFEMQAKEREAQIKAESSIIQASIKAKQAKEKPDANV